MSAEQNLLIEDYIKKQITVDTYFDIVLQLISSLEKMQRDGLQMVLDFKQMHISNRKLQFNIKMEDAIYETATVREFIKKLTFKCIFAPDQQCSAIGDFLRTIDTVSEVYFYNVVVDFCREQLDQKQSGSGQLNSPNVQNNSMSHVPTQPEIRGGNNGETGVLSDDFWKNLEKKNQGQASSMQKQSAYAVNDAANGETGVLDPSYWQKISQGNSGDLRTQTVSARLVHAKTGNRITINSDEFWIGKGNVDLKIDKDVISRKHAKIVKQQNHFFIVDNDSTNKTFVDGKEIPAKASIELFNGMHIKFANDEYIFEC